MLLVAQMLLLLFIMAIVFIVTKPVPKPIRVGIFSYFIINIFMFTWMFVNTDNIELTRIFSALIIIGLILVIIYRLFLLFGHLENWQKVILLFASLVNGAILYFLLQTIFNLVYIQLGASV